MASQAWQPVTNELAFIRQAFRDTADHDYIAARALYRCELDQQFLWSAEQATEKYLKAILLYNGLDTSEFGHHLTLALEQVGKIDGLQVELPDDVHEFISYLAIYGVNRYLQYPSFTSGEELLKLDKTVWHLRRYCDYLRGHYINSKGEHVDVLPSHLKRIQSSAGAARPRQMWFTDGILERVLTDRKSPLWNHLIWENTFFGPRRGRSLGSFTFRYHSINPMHFLEPRLFHVIKARVRFPREVHQYFADLDKTSVEE